jgi:hypothetical protein
MVSSFIDDDQFIHTTTNHHTTARPACVHGPTSTVASAKTILSTQAVRAVKRLLLRCPRRCRAQQEIGDPNEPTSYSRWSVIGSFSWPGLPCGETVAATAAAAAAVQIPENFLTGGEHPVCLEEASACRRALLPSQQRGNRKDARKTHARRTHRQHARTYWIHARASARLPYAPGALGRNTGCGPSTPLMGTYARVTHFRSISDTRLRALATVEDRRLRSAADRSPTYLVWPSRVRSFDDAGGSSGGEEPSAHANKTDGPDPEGSKQNSRIMVR